MRLGLLLAAVAVVLTATAVAVGGILIAHAGPVCNAGVSSVGPVSIVGGHVTGDARPHTEACLP